MPAGLADCHHGTSAECAKPVPSLEKHQSTREVAWTSCAHATEMYRPLLDTGTDLL